MGIPASGAPWWRASNYSARFSRNRHGNCVIRPLTQEVWILVSCNRREARRVGHSRRPRLARRQDHLPVTAASASDT